ncbi:hypothetical protein evm_012179 [Chilo suppressalis]|nr:hypothetical protein evm_012179 [Chilo suppressalis]
MMFKLSEIADLLYLSKITSGFMVCPELVSKICLRTSSTPIRDNLLIYSSPASSNFRQSSLLWRASSNFNNLTKWADLNIDHFNTSEATAKRLVLYPKPTRGEVIITTSLLSVRIFVCHRVASKGSVSKTNKRGSYYYYIAAVRPYVRLSSGCKQAATRVKPPRIFPSRIQADLVQCAINVDSIRRIPLSDSAIDGDSMAGDMTETLGRVPETWRDANVQPVPKIGDRSDPANYRPIAVTSVLCKVLEKVLNNHQTRYLEDHSLINDRQYGFRPKRSTGDLLAYLTHIWGEAIHKRGESLAISLDIAKAFDRVWHKSLLSKLLAYGLPAQFCSWVADFLHERRIRVLTDGSSRFMSVNTGVPQGSVLSPTLFLLHINDLTPLRNIHCYADYSTLHAGYHGQAAAGQAVTKKKRENLVIELNQAFDHISEWGTRNLVEFNAKKTQACAFTAKKSLFLPLPSFQGTTLAL